MGFQGWLIKINGTEVNGKYIRDYKCTPNRQTDLDPWTDGTGKTHRNILPHVRTTITLTTPPLTQIDKAAFKKLFPRREQMEIQYWNDDEDAYKTGDFYVSDVEYEYLGILDGTLYYKPITIEFIEY